MNNENYEQWTGLQRELSFCTEIEISKEELYQ